MSTASPSRIDSNCSEDARFRPSFFATKPTAATRFMRTFLPWQIFRFAWINLRMIVIIWRSHH